MSYYIPKHFKLYELLPPDMYALYRHKGNILWSVLFDYKAIYTIDRLQVRYGTTICNDYHWGGLHKERGFRRFKSEIGAELSQHKFGRAIDCKFKYISAEKVRQDILAEPLHEDFKYITCIEIDITWLHFDTRNWNKADYGILQVTRN